MNAKKWNVKLSSVDEWDDYFYDVYFKGNLLAEIRRNNDNYYVRYLSDKTPLKHEIIGTWNEEIIQQLLFLIKQRLKSDYTHIEYSLDE